MLSDLAAEPDNTFAGAADRLSRFTAFQAAHKSKLFSEHINLQAIMNNLATRLADNKRPGFCPPAPLDVVSRAAALDSIQGVEQKVSTTLYEELNRQHRLRSQNKRHVSRHTKLLQWVADHRAQVPEVAAIKSSGQVRITRRNAHNHAHVPAAWAPLAARV